MVSNPFSMKLLFLKLEIFLPSNYKLPPHRHDKNSKCANIH